jgi:hypothetical protein
MQVNGCFDCYNKFRLVVIGCSKIYGQTERRHCSCYVYLLLATNIDDPKKMEDKLWGTKKASTSLATMILV